MILKTENTVIVLAMTRMIFDNGSQTSSDSSGNVGRKKSTVVVTVLSIVTLILAVMFVNDSLSPWARDPFVTVFEIDICNSAGLGGCID